MLSISSCLHYRLFPFPTEKKNHFADGEPTLVNRNPTLNMGYDTTSRALLCSPPTGKRKCTEEKGWINFIRRVKTSKLDKTQKKEATIKDNIPDTETFDDELDKNETVDIDLFDLEKSLKTDIIGNSSARNQENGDASVLNKKFSEEEGSINLIRTNTSILDKTQKKEATKDNILERETFDNELEMNETVDFDLFDLEKNLETDIIHNINTRNQENEDASTLNTSCHVTFDLFLIILSLLLLMVRLLYEKVLMLEGKIKEMENEKIKTTFLEEDIV